MIKGIILGLFLLHLQSCMLYSSQTAWEEMNNMFKEANGRKICMDRKDRIHTLYYCENGSPLD